MIASPVAGIASEDQEFILDMLTMLGVKATETSTHGTAQGRLVSPVAASTSLGLVLLPRGAANRRHGDAEEQT